MKFITILEILLVGYEKELKHLLLACSKPLGLGYSGQPDRCRYSIFAYQELNVLL